jgi:hypothetical protein
MQVINSRRLRWVWHVTCVGENRNVYSVVVELKNKGAFGRPRYIWEIILKWILIKTNPFQFLVQHVTGDRILLFLCSFYKGKKLDIFKYTTVCSIAVTQLQYVPSQ